LIQKTDLKTNRFDEAQTISVLGGT
jgi:hypothetical protein